MSSIAQIVARDRGRAIGQQSIKRRRRFGKRVVKHFENRRDNFWQKIKRVSGRRGVVLIPLTQGKFALVDSEDLPRLRKKTWCFNGRYACTTTGGRRHKVRTIYLHRFVMRCYKKSVDVHHRNENKLDCTKSNLQKIRKRKHQRLHNKSSNCL